MNNDFTENQNKRLSPNICQCLVSGSYCDNGISQELSKNNAKINKDFTEIQNPRPSPNICSNISEVYGLSSIQKICSNISEVYGLSSIQNSSNAFNHTICSDLQEPTVKNLNSEAAATASTQAVTSKSGHNGANTRTEITANASDRYKLSTKLIKNLIEKSSLCSTGLCSQTTDPATNVQAKCCLTYATLFNNNSLTIEQVRVKVREEIKKRYDQAFNNGKIKVCYSLNQNTMENMKWSTQIKVGIIVIHACSKFLGRLKNKKKLALLD